MLRDARNSTIDLNAINLANEFRKFELPRINDTAASLFSRRPPPIMQAFYLVPGQPIYWIYFAKLAGNLLVV